MAGGPKLSDYRMTEKEYILAETIVEMTDKSELFRIGLENLGWSEIEDIPTGNRPHNLRYILKQESWIARFYLSELTSYILCKSGVVVCHSRLSVIRLYLVLFLLSHGSISLKYTQRLQHGVKSIFRLLTEWQSFCVEY